MNWEEVLKAFLEDYPSVVVGLAFLALVFLIFTTKFDGKIMQIFDEKLQPIKMFLFSNFCLDKSLSESLEHESQDEMMIHVLHCRQPPY